jgi:acetyl-CoA carboxylase biotin carboxyl carrier protein
MTILKVQSEVAGKVWQIVASPGQELEIGAAIVILESMKMEIPVSAPEKGRLVSIEVKEEDVVEEGQLVATIER